ncbi:uncharacterized protein JN550_011386 [Neoarthrinium moseri]|uniref:uncharacterized protein n=1 Tax=Neoarthrinium moseri TaxID=1658444 RepID=UPI001FDBEE46|nr:uncharacterized protein JN550_011386 [Neoarthrinium moseri]KAI1860661.1 hypothetical protein JN550_011386 [Neoarthrinium moseri]
MALQHGSQGLEARSDDQNRRVPKSSSIVELNSVIGDHGRMYNGYREGNTSSQMTLTNKTVWISSSGVWDLEFARENPNSNVIGIDLSKVQPELESVLNCDFIKTDAEETWILNYPFDYVRHAFDNVNSGSWIEYQDSTAFPYRFKGDVEGTAFKRWCDLFVQSGAALGRDLLIPLHYKHWLVEAGFVNVVERQISWPLAPWPENRARVGAYNSLSWPFEATRSMLVKGSGLQSEGVDEVIQEAKQELKDPE